MLLLVVLLPFVYGCKEKHVKYEDSGKTIHLMVDQMLKVQLPANASTGNDWRKTAYDNELIYRMGKPNYMLGDGRDGSAGMVIFRFKALKPGKTKLTMEYGSKYDSDKTALKNFELDIVIVDKK